MLKKSLRYKYIIFITLVFCYL